MNIAELLEDVPKGTKLYSPIFGEVLLKSIEDGPYPITVYHPLKGHQFLYYYMEDGRYEDYKEGECLLFPSKKQRNWSKFKVDLPIDTLVVVFEDIQFPEEAAVRRYGGNYTYKTRGGNLYASNHIVPLSKIKEVDGMFVFDDKDNYGRSSI